MNCLFISYSYIFLWNLAIVHCFIYYLFIYYLRLSPTGCPHLSLLFLISNNALNISSSRSDRGPTYCRVQIVLEVINGRQDSLRPTLGIVDVDVWIKNRISSVIETYIRIINVSGTLIAAATGSTVIGTMERRQLWEEISKDLYQALEISTCEISREKKSVPVSSMLPLHPGGHERYAECGVLTLTVTISCRPLCLQSSITLTSELTIEFSK